MKKISLNLDQETPFALKQAMMKNREYSQKSFSPLKKTRDALKPKDNISQIKEFSGISPIKAVIHRDSDASFRSILPNNQYNITTNISKNDSFWTSDSLYQRKFEMAKVQKNLLNPTPNIPFSRDQREEKENYEPNKYLGNPKNNQYQRVKYYEEPAEVVNNNNVTMKNRRQTTNQGYASKFNLDNNNISEYIEDFDNSYNLQILMMNKEYRNQYIFIAVFILCWIYFLSVVANGLNSLMHSKPFDIEEEYIYILFAYLKYMILLTLIIYSRIASFETVSRNLGWKEEIAEIFNILDGLSSKASSFFFSFASILYLTKETYHLFFSSIFSIENNFLYLSALIYSIFLTFQYYLNQNYFIESKLDISKYKDSYATMIYYGFSKSFTIKSICRNIFALVMINSIIFCLHEFHIAFVISNVLLTENYESNSFISSYTWYSFIIFSGKLLCFAFFIFLSIEIPTNVSKKLRLKSVSGFEFTRNYNPLYIFSLIFHLGKKNGLTNCFNESIKYLLINLPFPSKSFLHKQLIDHNKSIDFTLWDALINISSERISMFYSILAENKAKLESLMNYDRMNNHNLSITQKIKNYFVIRRIMNDIYSHLHIIILIIHCIYEGILISKHHKSFIFNLQKGSFKRFLEIMNNIKSKSDEYDYILNRAEQMNFRKFVKKFNKLRKVIKTNVEISINHLEEEMKYMNFDAFNKKLGSQSLF